MMTDGIGVFVNILCSNLWIISHGAFFMPGRCFDFTSCVFRRKFLALSVEPKYDAGI